MGRESTVTPEQVFAAADAIKAAGASPTLRAVRDRLGSGSMATVNRHLQQWRAGQAPRAGFDPLLPPALQRALLDFLASETSAAKAPLEAELAEQHQTNADLTRENERQAATIDEQANLLEVRAAEKATLAGRAEQLGADLTKAQDDAARERAAAEHARTELAKALLRLEALPRLEGDLAALRAELATERQARVDAEQRAAVLAAQKADLESRLAEARRNPDHPTNPTPKRRSATKK